MFDHGAKNRSENTLYFIEKSINHMAIFFINIFYTNSVATTSLPSSQANRSIISKIRVCNTIEGFFHGLIFD